MITVQITDVTNGDYLEFKCRTTLEGELCVKAFNALQHHVIGKPLWMTTIINDQMEINLDEIEEVN